MWLEYSVSDLSVYIVCSGAVVFMFMIFLCLPSEIIISFMRLCIPLIPVQSS